MWSKNDLEIDTLEIDFCTIMWPLQLPYLASCDFFSFSEIQVCTKGKEISWHQHDVRTTAIYNFRVTTKDMSIASNIGAVAGVRRAQHVIASKCCYHWKKYYPETSDHIFYFINLLNFQGSILLPFTLKMEAFYSSKIFKYLQDYNTSHNIQCMLERKCSQTHLCQLRCLMAILDNYGGTSIYRFSRGWRKQTMNAGKRSIQETITHCKYVVRSSSKVS